MAASWLQMDASSDFSLANIPFGIISHWGDPSPHAAVAIGSDVLDLKVLSDHPDFLDMFPALKGSPDVFSQPTLNAFAALGRAVHGKVRRTIQALLREDSPDPAGRAFLRDNAELCARALIPQARVVTHLPLRVGDYTDFYAGYYHAHAVGVLLRGRDKALQPNYLHLPVGYHGRASSIVVSGTPVTRPLGQMLLASPKTPTPTPMPTTGPSRKLDFELELACFMAEGNELGHAVGVDEADERIFGYALLNDWSARDVQAWEYVPLGPFNGKNFATTVSPWVVLADALEPFRAEGIENPVVGEGAMQGYLRESRRDRVFDLRLEVDLTTCEGNTSTLTRTSARNLIWSFPQMMAHHTLGGCPLRTGDMLGSGTISGAGEGEQGSLLEMTDNGTKDVLLGGMEARRFLLDGDEVAMRGYGIVGGDAVWKGQRVGFGECRGRVYASTPCTPGEPGEVKHLGGN